LILGRNLRILKHRSSLPEAALAVRDTCRFSEGINESFHVVRGQDLFFPCFDGGLTLFKHEFHFNRTENASNLALGQFTNTWFSMEVTLNLIMSKVSPSVIATVQPPSASFGLGRTNEVKSHRSVAPHSPFKY
jgi:hypothetical protein